jgi:HEAT repeat protein
MQGLSFLEDPSALDALLDASRDPNPSMRAGAMRALGNVASPLRVAGALIKGLSDADPWVRYYAAQSLGRIHYAPAAEAVIPLLQDPAGQVRVSAVEALSHLRSDNASRALRLAAESADPDVQRAALIGLGMGKRDEDLTTLLNASGAADPATRLVAISAVSGFFHPRVLSTLTRAAQDSDENVRTAAISFLAARRGIEATRALINLLTRPALREAALAALAISAEGRIEGLISSLETADDELAPLLTASLARLQRADATAALFQALELPSSPARKAAASTLAALGTRAALDALRKHSEADPDPEVRRICALLLAG